MLPNKYKKGAVNLFYVDRDGEIEELIINPDPHEDGKFMLFGDVFPSLNSIIAHYKTRTLFGSNDIFLGKGILPVLTKVENVLTLSIAEEVPAASIVSAGMFKRSPPIVEDVATNKGCGYCCVM